MACKKYMRRFAALPWDETGLWVPKCVLNARRA
jgi:hypothetical protein